jgi:propane monooxygenase coupling protein
MSAPEGGESAAELARGSAAGNDMGEASYDYVGIVMSKSVEGDAIADLMRGREGVDVTENASLWDIRSRERLIINFEEVNEVLGFDVDPYAIQYEMTTHYGRLVATDEALMLFSDPAEAMEYYVG